MLMSQFYRKVVYLDVKVEKKPSITIVKEPLI